MSHKILCKGIVWLSDWEQHRFFISGLFVRFICVLFPNIFCQTESRPRFGPTCIKGCVCNNFGNFTFCNTIRLCRFQMMNERGISKSLRKKRYHGNQRAFFQREFILSTPYLTEKYIIIEFCEFRRKFSEGGSSCCWLYCHIAILLKCDIRASLII